MAEGWNRNEGKVPFRYLSDEEVKDFVAKLTSTEQFHTTSYKYAFFQALLDNLSNVDKTTGYLSYDDIARSFANQYWDQTLKIKQSQMITHDRASSSVAEKIIINFCHENTINEYKCFQNLSSDQIETLIKKFKTSIVKKDVLGAFWKDTEGQFYSFSKQDPGIYMNPSCYTALTRNQTLFANQNKSAWYGFLNKVNSKLPAMIISIFSALATASSFIITKLVA
ncbi:MAG: hypothetical protein MJ182_10305 [Treponema sp.]|nr:hypothetical protein [Treponema sp.]